MLKCLISVGLRGIFYELSAFKKNCDLQLCFHFIVSSLIININGVKLVIVGMT